MVKLEGQWARWRPRLQAVATWGRWVVGAALVLAVFLASLFLYRSREMLWHYARAADYGWLAASFVWYTLDLALAAMGWSLVMRGLTGQGSWRHHFAIYCISNIGRRLPGTFWYVAGRTALYQRQGISASVVSLASGLEYLLLTAAAILLALMCLPFGAKFEPGQIGLMIVGLALALLGIHPRFIRFILRRWRKDAPEKLRYRDTLMWVFWYLGVWAGGGLLLYSVLRAFYPVPLTALPFVVGVWATAGVAASLVFLTPGGLGVTEVSLSLMLSSILPVALSVALTVVFRLLIIFYELVWACVAWFWRRA